MIKSGSTLRTINGATVVVERFLGGDGQGNIYRVKYNGYPKALKMYIPKKVKNLTWLHKNLSEKIDAGKPTEKFIWPEDLTEWKDGTFGYIMDLKPAEYMDFSDLLLEKQEMSSFTAMINCAIRMVSAFGVLHLKGMCYQALNDGNFFIRKSDGDILVCDNDNASPVDNPSGIAGKARYMAPSVVVGGKPSYKTDRFSLAVCLFLLFVRTHPLEGVRTLSVPEMNDYYLQLCYGKDPIFIADPTDTSNRPDKAIKGVRNYYKRWSILSKNMQDMFIKAFSKEAMLHDERKFPSEKEWERTLLQYRSLFVKCPICGKETLIDDAQPTCRCCHQKYPVYGVFKIENYEIPIVKNGGIFQEHLDNFSRDVIQYDPKRVSVVRVNSKKNLVALENVSESNWTYKYPDGKYGITKPGEYVALINGTEIKMSGTTVIAKM